jgi:hypothetical protein
MISVSVVEPTSHEVIRVIAVRHCLVAAVAAVLMVRCVAGMESRRAFVRVLRTHRDAMLVDVIPVRVMQMHVVEIIRMSIVLHHRVPASVSVSVRVSRVALVLLLLHGSLPWTSDATQHRRQGTPAVPAELA